MNSGRLPRIALGAGAAVLPALAAVHAAPVISTFGPLRNRIMPRLSGQGRPDHVALTFDDGPDPEFTPPLLDVLQAAGAGATFFVVGERIGGNEDLLRELEARGHEVALHGMTHRRHDELSAADARTELVDGLAAIEAAGVTRPRWYRPPYGAASEALAHHCRELGLGLAYWSAWGQDWDPIPAARIARLVERDLGLGAIVLLHDSPLYAEREDAGPTIAAIPAIAAAARQRGLELVSLRAATAPGDPQDGAASSSL
jgi:peptidoglycan/xylan/chitin deacetylase (PgdA/CDA1 family)